MLWTAQRRYRVVVIALAASLALLVLVIQAHLGSGDGFARVQPALHYQISTPPPLPDLPDDYCLAASSESLWCQDRFGARYLEKARDSAVSLCNDVSASRFTCFLSRTAGGSSARVDAVCHGRRAVFDDSLKLFRLGCDTRPLTPGELDRGVPRVPDGLPRYWYETGPGTVMHKTLAFDKTGAPGRSQVTTILVKREGDANPWHSLMEIMSLSWSVDLLHTILDPETNKPFLGPVDGVATQVVLLGEHGYGPYIDLWGLFAKMPIRRIHELKASEPLTDIIVPFSGGKSAVRWLGIWLDSTLAFKTHVEKWTAKAQKVAHHLKAMTTTNRGPLPSAVRRAVRACIEPQLLFGAEAWYPGMTRPNWSQPTREGPSGIMHLVRRMDKSLHTAVRAVLPIWKTTPLSARYREAGIPPVSQLLESCRLRFAARLRSLDKAHPLVVRTEPIRAPVINRAIKLKYQLPRKPFRTRLRRADELLPRCARPELLPSTQICQRPHPANCIEGGISGQLPRLAPDMHMNELAVSDGNGRLGPAEVFDAEANGALGLHEPERIVVCLDNIAVATCLQGMPSDSPQKEFLEFQALAAEHGATEIRWIPGHTNIAGTEQADALAGARRKIHYDYEN
ncbi:endonuclease/exonuclease/phosphatase [Purpureocillium lavendulum]|uniref:Endonuclease/exonuclease/phosphatase n=1 Tax=Purpureocillium lavendulum TaxID=1247861 RepID=A0AB34FGK3_9HYPO|nr:endonuclease/exonuclease/phosphatase [Purpureocillium lavendulum]